MIQDARGRAGRDGDPSAGIGPGRSGLSSRMIETCSFSGMEATSKCVSRLPAHDQAQVLRPPARLGTSASRAAPGSR